MGLEIARAEVRGELGRGVEGDDRVDPTAGAGSGNAGQPPGRGLGKVGWEVGHHDKPVGLRHFCLGVVTTD